MSLLVDGLIYKGEGWTRALSTSSLDIAHVTAADFFGDFGSVCDGIGAWWDWFDRDADRLRPVLTVTDLDPGAKDRRIGVVLGLQNAAFIEAHVERITLLWRLGIRVLQLAYNDANLFGDGCLEERNAGLTKLGRRIVNACNRVGIAVDVSHVGLRSALDVIEVSTSPVIASHANRSKLTPSPRNKQDNVLKGIAASGGVVGVTPYGPLCWDGRGRTPPPREAFVRHVLDMVELLGEDSVALASDLPAVNARGRIDSVVARSNTLYPEIFARYAESVGAGFSDRYCQGFGTLMWWSEIYELLAGAGMQPAVIDKVVGRNWLRVYGSVWNRRDQAASRSQLGKE